jgi:hypothetical protein
VGLAETLAELIIAEELKRGGELTISRTDPFFLFISRTDPFSSETPMALFVRRIRMIRVWSSEPTRKNEANPEKPNESGNTPEEHHYGRDPHHR